MDSYAPLLERTRVPQPSLQRLAVISIFEKLRSAPSYIDSDSDPGTDAISQCLHSTSPAVVDQAVRELCRLVTDSKMELSRGLLELQSAIEGSNSRFVNVFVKAIGFLVHVGFQKNISLFRVESPESHPFVKVLSGGTEVHSELVQQVLLFISQNKGSRMVEVCDFLRPFSNFSVLRIAFSDSSASSFVRHLISSTASLCCSFPREAMPVFKLLMGCLRYYPQKNAEDFKIFINIMEYMVDAYTVVLKHLVGVPSLSNEAQLCGLELLETVHSQHSDHHKHFGGSEPIVELSKRLLVVQKELGLPYIPELLLLMSSLFVILIRSELEHEQLPVLKLVLFLLKWKNENEYMVGRAQCDLSEELLFVFPVINFVSSPSTSVKEAATDLLFMLEKVLVNFAIAPKEEPSLQGGFPSISRPASIIFRLLQQLWFQVYFFLFFISILKIVWFEVLNGFLKFLLPLLKLCGYLSAYSGNGDVFAPRHGFHMDKDKFIFIFNIIILAFVLVEMPLLLSAIACGLFMHHSLGCAAIDSLAAIGIMDPKLGVTMLLTILFFNNIFSSKGIGFHDMLLKLLGMLPSLASHSVMIPLVVQTILPMLHENAKPVLYATATRLLCKTWEINDRAFGSLQGVLLPKGFNKFMSERNICIKTVFSVLCSVHAVLRPLLFALVLTGLHESRDPVIQSLGFQSLAHLCEADVIGCQGLRIKAYNLEAIALRLLRLKL
ncbi:Protein RST1 [Vitis vinifera]|uniref:Protein RST1 n=1 Tax=Vitis vinifera TaxID=29760 RepID=A0A438EFU2_VITVI|nr:Protein RST1 [Vitis vinifera]